MLGELVPRSSGILLHPTALPGPYGIGDLGPAAHAWVEVLARAGQGWWQVLPVGPTGYGDSPYQSPSTFAGNGSVHYADVIPRKQRLVRRAWERFVTGDGPTSLRAEFDHFRTAEASW